MARSDVSLETLLGHEEWLRALARRMVSDADVAEDAAQQVWLGTLRAPPRDGSNPRGWLSAVLRNAVRKQIRGDGRRRHHELQAPPKGAEPPVADTVARADAHRRVVEAVMELPQVQRDAVLLRFFDGLPPREVARRTGAPVATVRTRIHRALATLRTRLEHEYGDRRAWSAALLLLARDRPGPHGAAAAAGAASSGALIMSLTVKSLLAATVAAALFFGTRAVLVAGDDPAPDPPETAVVPVDFASGSWTDVSAPSDPEDASSTAPVEEPEKDDTPAEKPSEEETEQEDSLRVLEASGSPVGGAHVLALSDDGHILARLRTGPDGRIRGKSPEGIRRWLVAARARPPVLAAAEQGVQEVRLRDGAHLVGLVRVDGEIPSEPLQLTVHVSDPWFPADKLAPATMEALHELGFSDRRFPATTFDQGGIAFSGLQRDSVVIVYFPDGYVRRATRQDFRKVEVPAQAPTFDLLRLPRVRGRIVGADGKGVADAQIEIHYETAGGGEGGLGTTANEDGSFDLFLDEPDVSRVVLRVADAEGMGAREIEAPAGIGPDRELGDLSLAPRREVVLRVLGPDGKPVAGAVGGSEEGALSERSGADGLVRLSVGEGAARVHVAALGLGPAPVEVDGGADGPVDVHLRKSAVLTIRPSLPKGATGKWVLRVRGPIEVLGGDGPDGASTPDAVAAALAAAAGATRVLGISSGPNGVIAQFTVDAANPEPVVVSGVRPNTEVRLTLLDPEQARRRAVTDPRAATAVTLASGERREVSLAAE